MQALVSLQQDHRLLLELTDALEAFARALPDAEVVPLADLEAFAHAFREFADNLHYEKEEHVLMPFLARHGYDWNGALLAQVRCGLHYLADHREDRLLFDYQRSLARIMHYQDRPGALAVEQFTHMAAHKAAAT